MTYPLSYSKHDFGMIKTSYGEKTSKDTSVVYCHIIIETFGGLEPCHTQRTWDQCWYFNMESWPHSNEIPSKMGYNY